MTHNLTFTPGVYTMRNGMSATVYEVAQDGVLIGAYTNAADCRVPGCWLGGGEYTRIQEHHLDLMPPRSVIWLNSYGNQCAYGYPTREEADRLAGRNRIACIRVEYTPGEGLEP